MKNFIFKSEADFHKIVFNKLDVILSEQKHQRCDLATNLRHLQKIINTLSLQKQVDDYFDRDNSDIPDTENSTDNTESETV